MPACENADWSASTSSVTLAVPVEYCSENDSFAPDVTPGPHSSGAGPGRTHTSAPPFTIFQPCALSCAVAAAGSYAYGFCFCWLDTNLLAGTSGTGPYVGFP